ncbi:nucleotidyl transferase AbiEii/AbiGii toxin family protein [Aureivirga sp. CE67]|uniref:nucleotidyl transferase AbiEii/AbiGii toxin family protein n=1 Tax=Aureivirga sp. CE67 TaxID=1788983 RepID=UPI0018CAC579|nr:nucleotidyl transferase AbiEii/AbiGii toxin family protein [Aureivirga sp. CE67]
MNRFYNIPENSKKRIYQNVSVQHNLPAYAIEKDWWVVQTLTLLFQTEIGNHLVFKGGTSLSKSWGLIERFSEDIDLAVDRTFFGFSGDLGKKQITKLRKAANHYITSNLLEELKNLFNSNGLTDVKLELETITSSDQDPVIIGVYYPSIVKSPGYIRPRVQIEIGCRSLQEPFDKTAILSLVDDVFHNKEFTQEAIKIPSVLPERTFLEKIFLLHEEFQKPKEKIRVDRLSRHLYDIYQIIHTPHAMNAIQNKNLYETIVNHRKRFTKISGIDYNLHQPKTLSFLPPPVILEAWEKDYKTMQEQMIYGDSPNFKLLLKQLSTFQEKIYQLDFQINLL